MSVIVREPSGVKSLFLRGRVENEDTSEGMDAACRGGGAITGVSNRVEPTSRRGAGYSFGVLGRDRVGVTGNGRDDRTLPGGGDGSGNWVVGASVRVLCVCGRLTSLPSTPHITFPASSFGHTVYTCRCRGLQTT